MFPIVPAHMRAHAATVARAVSGSMLIQGGYRSADYVNGDPVTLRARLLLADPAGAPAYMGDGSRGYTHESRELVILPIPGGVRILLSE